MKSLLRTLAFGLCRKRIDESHIESVHMTLEREELRFFSLSTNTIISFERDGQLYYFRECPKVLPFADYCRQNIDEFFNNLRRVGIHESHFKQKIPIPVCFPDDTIERFRADIDRRLADPSFIAMLRRLDVTAVRQGFSIWDDPHFDTAYAKRLGLDGVTKELLDISIFFLWYMRSVALNYKTLHVVRGNTYSYFNASKSIASAIVAEELGLSSLITDARFCTLEIQGDKERFGVISPAADGCRMRDTAITPSGVLQRELLALNVLDGILYQPDHGPNNYNVSADHRICAFDNDNPHTFFPFFSLRHSLAGCCPLVDTHGMIARPFLDSAIAGALRDADVGRLKRRLRPYLNRLQIAALIYRLKRVNKAIADTQKARPFLLETHAFNDHTVETEQNGDYGTTYLIRAINSYKGEV